MGWPATSTRLGRAMKGLDGSAEPWLWLRDRLTMRWVLWQQCDRVVAWVAALFALAVDRLEGAAGADVGRAAGNCAPASICQPGGADSRLMRRAPPVDGCRRLAVCASSPMESNETRMKALQRLSEVAGIATSAIGERRVLAKELKRLSERDPLTGLFNSVVCMRS